MKTPSKTAIAEGDNGYQRVVEKYVSRNHNNAIISFNDTGTYLLDEETAINTTRIRTMLHHDEIDTRRCGTTCRDSA